MGLLYGRAGRLTAESGGFRPGQGLAKGLSSRLGRSSNNNINKPSAVRPLPPPPPPPASARPAPGRSNAQPVGTLPRRPGSLSRYDIALEPGEWFYPYWLVSSTYLLYQSDFELAGCPRDGTRGRPLGPHLCIRA
jgi:hypothetical protein